MPLCIINVAKFQFDTPSISWDGDANNIIYSNGDSKTILLNTIYDRNVTKTLQKFNGVDWVDVAEIDTHYNVEYDTVGTDRYRVKAVKGIKVLYSNELTIIKNSVIRIDFDGEPTGNNRCIKFVDPLPANVRSYNLVVVSSGNTQRFNNRKCFQDDNAITGVYVEYEYLDGYKADSNTLDIVRDNSLEITWEGGGNEERTGYEISVAVEATKRGVSWQTYSDGGSWVKASFQDGKIMLNEGVNKIRGLIYRNNIISNVLVYNRRALAPLSITWENGGKAPNIVMNGTNLVIRLEEGYLETGIQKKVMHTYINGFETLKDVDDLSNMSFVKEGDTMDFKLKIHYNNGTVLESNTLKSKRLFIPKITWEDKQDKPKSGNQNNMIILKSDLVDGYTYKYQKWFRTRENDTTENWQDVTEGRNGMDTSQSGWYKFRLISNNNAALVSNVLEFQRIADIRNGTISWKGTSDTVVYNINNPIVVNADALGEGESYKIVVTSARNRYYRDNIPQEIRYTEGRDNKVGSLHLTRPDAGNVLRSRLEGEEEGTYRFLNDYVIEDNVNNISEVDVQNRESSTYGLHYFSLVYTNSNTGKTYTVGKPIIAILINNQLSINDYVYYDEWGIKKQTPDHSQTRYEVKSSWFYEKSRGFIYSGLLTPQLDTHRRTITLQKQTVGNTQWTDVNTISLLDSSFTKEPGVVKYRVKEVLHNGQTLYSNEVYTFNVGDILKFDTSKYYIVENIFNRNGQGKYNNIENQHQITATLLPVFTYQYQISVNGGAFENVGNTFTTNNPLNFSDVFRAGYPNGIVLIRLVCRIPLDRTTTETRYSNLIYAMFNAATLSWQEDTNDSVAENELVGQPPYTFRVSDIYRYGTENNGELKIYINRTNTNQTTYQQIIEQNQVINTERQAAALTKSINVTVDPFTNYRFTISWVNSFGIKHKGRSVIIGSNITVEISNKYDNTVRIPYEVKTTFPNAKEIYYDYQEATIEIKKHFNAPGVAVYTLQRADFGSNIYQDVFVLPNRHNGDTIDKYVIDRRLSKGVYRVKLTFNGTKHIYSNIVGQHVFYDILKVDNTYAVFGFNNTVADSGYDNQTQYNISYNVQSYPDYFLYKVQYSWSATDILAGDTVTTVGGKKVMSMNTFVDIGNEFSKTDSVDIKTLIGRKNGLVRVRLKVFENNINRTILGYSNTIWIFLDDSTFYFIPGIVRNIYTSFPDRLDGRTYDSNHKHKVVNSQSFTIRFKSSISIKNQLYMVLWNNTDTQNKYGNLINTYTGKDGTYSDINRNAGIYRFYRKVFIQEFGIFMPTNDYFLEQVLFYINNAYMQYVDTNSYKLIEYNMGGFDYTGVNVKWKKSTVTRVSASDFIYSNRVNRLEHTLRNAIQIDKFDNNPPTGNESEIRWKPSITYNDLIITEYRNYVRDTGFIILSQSLSYILKLYEVKTDYSSAADIYYQYQDYLININNYVNEPGTRYTLQKADLQSDNYVDKFVLEQRNTGTYTIDQGILETGRYRIKKTTPDNVNTYSNYIDKFSFDGILKVNNKFSIFGHNHTTKISGYDNQTQYDITYDLNNYPSIFKFKVQWCQSLNNILVNDTITREGNKDVMSMNSFLDIGREFSSTDTVDIKNLVGRRTGLTRIRLKVTLNGSIIGYSNIIWIYLDKSISYFVPARYEGQNSTFPLAIEGNYDSNRRYRLIGGQVFGIKNRHTYPNQRFEIYMSLWNGRDHDNKYEMLLARLTGGEIYQNINQDLGVYFYHRKTIIEPFNITLVPTEEPLEQVVMTCELENRHRYVMERQEIQGRTVLMRVSALSSSQGNYYILTYNNGSVELPLQFVLYESTNRNNNFIQANEQFFQEGTTRNVDSNGRKEAKFTNQSSGGRFRKIAIQYKNTFIAETNVSFFEYFNPIVSLDANLKDYDYVFFKDLRPNGNSITIYANNVQEPFRYKFQWKAQTFDGTPLIIDENGFEDQGEFFTLNDEITRNPDNLPLERDWFYVYRVSIWRGDTNIGFSNIVCFKT